MYNTIRRPQRGRKACENFWGCTPLYPPAGMKHQGFSFLFVLIVGNSPHPPRSSKSLGWSGRLPGHSLLSFRFFSALFRPLGQFCYHFCLIWEPLGPQKRNMFIKRIIKFQLWAIFVSDAALGRHNLPKHPKWYPREAQERSRAYRESPKSLQKPPPEST